MDIKAATEFLKKKADDGYYVPQAHWKKMWDLLLEHKTPSTQDPPKPLIFYPAFDSAAAKHNRLHEQLQWAANHDCLQEAFTFISSLDIKEWDWCSKDKWHEEPWVAAYEAHCSRGSKASGKYENELLDKLAKLRRQIASGNYPLEGMREWRGADVIICSQVSSGDAEWLKNQPIVISPQETDPMRRVVVTEYALELSWLFVALGKVFSGQIDYISKYDFYGSLAQAAIDHISQPEGNTDAKELLNAVLDVAEKFCSDNDCS